MFCGMWSLGNIFLGHLNVAKESVSELGWTYCLPTYAKTGLVLRRDQRSSVRQFIFEFVTLPLGNIKKIKLLLKYWDFLNSNGQQGCHFFSSHSVMLKSELHRIMIFLCCFVYTAKIMI